MNKLVLLAFLLYGCETKHGVKIEKNVVGMSKEDLYNHYGKSVIEHPLNHNTVFYFDVQSGIFKKKMKWNRITIKNNTVVDVKSDIKFSNPKIAKHNKPSLVKAKWISELFDYVGSASSV